MNLRNLTTSIAVSAFVLTGGAFANDQSNSDSPATVNNVESEMAYSQETLLDTVIASAKERVASLTADANEEKPAEKIIVASR